MREDLRERASSAAFASLTSCPALTSGRRKRFGEASEPTESTDCEPSAPRPARACASRAAFASWESRSALTSFLRRRPGEAAGLGARLAPATRPDFASTRSRCGSHSVGATESRHPQKDAVSPTSAAELHECSGRSKASVDELERSVLPDMLVSMLRSPFLIPSTPPLGKKPPLGLRLRNGTSLEGAAPSSSATGKG